MKLAHSIALASLAASLSPAAFARGVSPYLPLNLAPVIEQQIERVLILAGKPVMRRPIPAAVVLDALPSACEHDRVACEQVRRYLRAYMNRWGIAGLEVQGALSTDDANVPLPNRHGESLDSAWRANVSAFFQPNDHVIVNAGAIAYDGDLTPTGSFLSFGFDFAQVDVGFRDHWFSPAVGSAMLMSTNAPTLPSITLSNYDPISRLGFSYEIFAGELSESDRIAFGDGYTSGRPQFAGLHLAIEPATGWSLAANRVVQFGGGERGGRSFGDLFDALLNPYESDNRQQELSQEEEFGNQQAALTSQFIFPGAVPFTVYFEYAGDDTSYDTDYRLGNAALLAGIRFPRLWKFVDIVYEASEWQNGWYVHGIYQDGPTHEGHVVGHWGADHRAFGDGVGAQAHLFGLGWAPPFGGMLQASYRTVANENYSTGDYQRAHIVSLQYSRSFSEYTVGAEMIGGEDVFGEGFARFAAFARFGPAWGPERGIGVLETSKRAVGAELFVEAGLNVSELQVRLGDRSASLKTETGFSAGAHVGLGARRAVSERSDLGARLELEDLHGEYLLAVRALDYRYRFSARWAMTAFLGAARYDTGLPAYGYYMGAGAQWRNVLPNFDLNLDFRFADKIARDKLLPEDPPSTVRPDLFYDMYGAVLSLSYRW